MGDNDFPDKEIKKLKNTNIRKKSENTITKRRQAKEPKISFEIKQLSIKIQNTKSNGFLSSGANMIFFRAF